MPVGVHYVALFTIVLNLEWHTAFMTVATDMIVHSHACM